LRDIDAHGQGRHAEREDLVCGLCKSDVFDIRQHDAHAFARESLGHGKP
jgi:hypothetical protein